MWIEAVFYNPAFLNLDMFLFWLAKEKPNMINNIIDQQTAFLLNQEMMRPSLANWSEIHELQFHNDSGEVYVRSYLFNTMLNSRC